jgi:hypothetical protein
VKELHVSELLMKWDPELTELAERVRQTFGGDMLAEAYVRALASVPAIKCPPEFEDLVGHDTDIKVVDATASIAILKQELRRMLTAH